MYPSFSKNLGPVQISEIKQVIECDLKNVSHDETFDEFLGLNGISNNTLTFLNDNEIIENSNTLNNCTIICTKKKYDELKSTHQKAIIVKNVQEFVAKISNIFYRDFTYDEKCLFNKPKYGEHCKIDASAKVENGSTIGNNVSLGHGVFIGHNCVIGNNSKIEPNAVVTNSIIGENVRIGSNSSIGQSGFGFFLKNDANIDIYHFGKVIIQSNVSIGASCTIDRGSFDDTIVGENTYLDNLCHIAHNVQIGSNCAFAAMTGIAGSAKIGNNVLAGGQVGIVGHVTIGNNVQIAAKSGVFNNLDEGQVVMGNPAINKYKYIKTYKKNYGNK